VPDDDPAAPTAPGGPLPGLGAGDEAELVEIVDPDDAETDPRLVGSYRTRTGAREGALGLLYEAESKGVSPVEVMAALPVAPDTYTADVVRGVDTNRDELDALIERTSRNWSLARMPRIDLAVLRLGVYELRHRPDVPVAVVIN
jgi:N utilization substance protein B